MTPLGHDPTRHHKEGGGNQDKDSEEMLCKTPSDDFCYPRNAIIEHPTAQFCLKHLQASGTNRTLRKHFRSLRLS
jgi:hypothetical protein